MKTRGSKSRAAALACLVAGLLPLVVAPSLPGCGCNGAGCISGATVSVAIADDTDLRGATVTACFNDACVVSDPLPVFISLLDGTNVAFPDGSGVRGSLWPPGGAASAGVDRERLVVTWWFPDGTALRAGDRFRVNVDSFGNTIADKEETAIAYDRTEICHGACYTARFAEPSP